MEQTVEMGAIKGAPQPSPFMSLNSEKTEMVGAVIRSTEGRKLNVLGDNMTFKLTGEDTAGQFTLIQEYNDPGVGIPLHTHDLEDEVFKVLEGELELEVGEQKVILKAGDVGFAPRGVPHSFRVVGNEKARVDLSLFPAGIEHMFYELSALPASPPDFAQVAEICGRYGIRFV